jgi:hypothetical protein
VSLHGQEAPLIGGLTGAQRFFMSWARIWQTKTRDEEVLRLLTIDGHFPGELWLEPAARVGPGSRNEPGGPADAAPGGQINVGPCDHRP